MATTYAPLPLSNAELADVYAGGTDDNSDACLLLPFVVSIGVGKQGLKALRPIFCDFPLREKMAFVLFLCPDISEAESRPESLTPAIGTCYIEAKPGMEIRAGHIYCVTAREPLRVCSHRFAPLRGISLPHVLLDAFLISQAEEYKQKSIAVLLSCAEHLEGSGVRTVRACGGLSIALQEYAHRKPVANEHLSCQCDLSLPLEALVPRLVAYVAEVSRFASGSIFPSSQEYEQALANIYRKLRKVFRVNFAYYKNNAVLWRVTRRMGIHHLANLKAYSDFLDHNEAEIFSLAQDILVGFTRFFRDAEHFEALKQKVIIPLLQNSSPGELLRSWVVGCSTGEEAYSVAMLFEEAMHELHIEREIKIFATDANSQAINVARKGVYSERIVADLSPARLDAFFLKKGKEYHVGRSIRKKCLFAVHNVFSNPPFMGLNLITYRNLLIYFQPPLQKNVFGILHSVLKPQGYLFLGKNDSLGENAALFQPVAENEKIFCRHQVKAPALLDFSRTAPNIILAHSPNKPSVPPQAQLFADNFDVFSNILEALHVGGALLDAHNDVMHLYGRFENFLSLSVGAASRSIFTMLPEDVALLVATMLKNVRLLNAPVTYSGIPLKNGKSGRLIATPMRDEGTDTVALLFSEDQSSTTDQFQITHYDRNEIMSQRMTEMAQEIDILRSELDAKVTELRTLNQELHTVNAEIRVTNEELQASNQELQATNKELYVLNSQYEQKMLELQEANDDMENCINTTQVGSLFVDSDLCIRKCTSFINNEFNLSPKEQHSWLHRIEKYLIDCNIVDYAKRVLHSLLPIQREVQGVNGKYYMLRISPYRTADGGVNGLVVSFVDIQQLKQASARIEMLSYAIEQMPAAAMLSDLSGRVHYVNPRYCAMTGFSPQEVLGRNVRDFMPADMDDAAYAAVWDVVQRGENWSDERQCRRKDGSLYWERLALLPIINRNDETTSYLRVGEDVSASKIAQLSEAEHRMHLEEMVRLRTRDLEQSRNEAQAASQAKTTFLSTVSHEIRTPMNAIIGFTHIFDRTNLRPEQKEHLEKIQLSANTLLGIINDVLDISKIEAGKLELENKPFDLRTALDTVYGIMKVAAKAKSLALDVQLDDDVPSLFLGDVLRINQILLNLLNNAIKFTQEGGVSLRVSLDTTVPSAAQRILHFVVQDSGIGISAEQLPRLFSAFSQADGSIARRFGGTGLGLAICKELVNLMGGSIDVTSTPGKGSSIHFTLCLAPLEDSSVCMVPECLTPARAALPGFEYCRVLLVEDNELNQEIALALLHEQGLQVDCAATGQEALERAITHTYDCIFMDMQMPVMDGLEATQRMRTLGLSGEHPWLAEVPIIAMTANAMNEDRQRCLEAGMNEHIGKPIDPGVLRAITSRFLAAALKKTPC